MNMILFTTTVFSLNIDPKATGEGLSRLQHVDPLHIVPRVRLGGHGLDGHGVLAQRPLGAGEDLHEAEARVLLQHRSVSGDKVVHARLELGAMLDRRGGLELVVVVRRAGGGAAERHAAVEGRPGCREAGRDER